MKNYHLKIKPKVIPNFGGLSFGHLFSKIFFVITAFLILQGSIYLSAQSPLAANGKLSVSGTQLVNKNGTAIQLRGMSTHGTQWYTEDYNFNSLSVLVNKWGIDVFRIAMYPSDKPDATKNSYEGNPTFWKGYVDNLVDICGKLGVYSIIDWHVLTPGDPNDPTYLPMAKEFWDYMSKKHAGKNQVMYEICNEPNGITWATVKAYANIIIPIIRANDPNSIIIVGSPTWSSDVDIAATDPIKDPVNATKLASNVMYTFHFYAATHGQSYRDKITTALGKGLPIFVTEWGSTDASGGGTSNWTETQTWMDFLATNKISWANWSYSDKSETSAVLQPGSGALLLWDNTNAQGDKIKILIATPADSWISTGNWSPAVTISSPLIGDYFLPGTKVTLTATPVDKDGTIVSVDFLVDGVKIGTATAAPYSYQWTPTTVKDYVVTSVAKDNAGATGTSTPFTYHVVASINETAYPSGTAWPVPGDIACMNFDNGGEMIAYHDLDAVHKGTSGSSRPTEGVDVEGSANIGYVLTGEWLKYTVNVASAGTYDFTLQTASGLPGTDRFHLESNGVPITAITDVPSSGSWGSYQPVIVKSVPLNAGIQVIKLYIDCGNFNFSTMNFKLTGSIIYSITASAGTGGTISPTGKVTVSQGGSQTFSIAALNGYAISAVTVDGASIGAVASYTFTNVIANHTIAATFAVQSCNLLTQYGVPRATALPTMANSTFKYAYVLGTGGPSLTNIQNFTINWDLPNKGLRQFSMNTNNGVPSWWLDLLPKISQTFGSASPACKITGSGIAGFDGDYWVTLDGTNFVMVSKTGTFAVYASSSATPPTSCAKSALAANTDNGKEVSVYPNPVDKNSTLNMNLGNIDSNGAQYYIIDINNKTVISGNLRAGDNKISLNGNVNSGLYIIRISNGNEQYNQKLIVK